MKLEKKNSNFDIKIPLLTVITIVYNDAKNIERTIKSILNQTYRELKFIIIDGGSTDGTVDIIKKYEYKIDYWISEPDKGIYDAMNKGMKLATGNWIVFMNSGDLFFDNEVINNVSVFFKNDYGVVYGDVKITYDINNMKIKKAKTKNFKNGMPFCTQSAFINIKFIEENSFNPSYKVFGDLDFFLQLETKKIPMVYVEKIISIFDYNGVSSQFSFKNEFEKFSILKKYYNAKAYLYLIKIVDRFIRSIFKQILPISIIRKIQLNK